MLRRQDGGNSSPCGQLWRDAAQLLAPGRPAPEPQPWKRSRQQPLRWRQAIPVGTDQQEEGCKPALPRPWVEVRRGDEQPPLYGLKYGLRLGARANHELSQELTPTAGSRSRIRTCDQSVNSRWSNGHTGSHTGASSLLKPLFSLAFPGAGGCMAPHGETLKHVVFVAPELPGGARWEESG